MSTTYDNVIIFGPTGDVGGSAALEASKQGAKVWLAMRDTSKSIEKLANIEKQGSFERVKADLSDVESIKEAIKKSGAKAAYIYYVHGPNYREVTKALKDAGIEHVVFLSSFTVHQDDDLKSIPQSEIISWMHAQTEVALDEAGFPSVVAIRAGNFASNPGRMGVNKSTKTATMLKTQNHKVDAISPDDIGQVAGNVLAKKPSSKSKEIIYVLGHELIAISDQWKIINEVTGKDFKVNTLEDDEYIEHMTGNKVPKPFAEYMVRFSKKPTEYHYPGSVHQEGFDNVKKYTGREPVTFRKYVETHKDMFD